MQFANISLQQVSYAVSIIIGTITLCSLVVKIGFKVIDMKFAVSKAETKADESKFVMWDDLKKFCNESQTRCPSANELGKISQAITGQTKVLDQVVNEQKILRQNTLPFGYVNKDDFNGAINRIEQAVREATTEMKTSTKEINDKLDGLRNLMDDRIKDVYEYVDDKIDKAKLN